MAENNKKLTDQEIKKLLSREAKPDPWPNEANLIKLAKAVKAEEDTVTFDGTEFSIQYNEKWQAVFIKPTSKSYVPCGWFNFDRLRGVLK